MIPARWTRSWCVNPVAFDAQGRLDLDEYRRHVRFVTDGGMTGLVPLGLVGGGLQLTPRQRDEVVTATLEAAGPDVLVYPAILDPMGAAELAERIDRYADLGAHGIYLGTPPMLRADAAGTLALFDAALQATRSELPVVCYDNSDFTGSRLGIDGVLRLEERHGRVAGYKQNDPTAVHRVVAEVAGRFAVAPPCYDRFTIMGYEAGCTFQAAAGASLVPRAVSGVSALVGAGDLGAAAALAENFAPLQALPEPEWLRESLAVYAGIYCHLLGRVGFRFTPPPPFAWPLPASIVERLDRVWDEVAPAVDALGSASA